MFDPKSRYAKVDTFTVIDARGREVTVVHPAPRPVATTLGIHLLKQGERLDHLAARYLGDPAGFWRIAEQNDVMFSEALSGVWGFAEQVVPIVDASTQPPEIQIPNRNG